MWILKRVSSFLLTIWVAFSITFFLSQLVPGDPFASEEHDSVDSSISLKKYYGLDQPLHLQYLKYIKEALHGNLGVSLKYQGKSVNAIIAESFPISFSLGVTALLFSIAIGFPLGTLSAFNQEKKLGKAILWGTFLLISIPCFLSATLSQYLFSIQLHWLPIGRWSSWKDTLLPVFILAIFPTGMNIRLLRSNMITILKQDFILTAKMKGLSNYHIAKKHVIKNSIIPLISYLSTIASQVLTGSFIVENIFGIPGMGQWFVLSVLSRDYYLTLSLTLIYTLLLSSFTLIADLLYRFANPKIGYV